MYFYRRLAAVRAISFDLDDTLYDNYPYMRQAEQQLMDFLHHSYALTRHTDMAFWRKFKAALLHAKPQLQSDMGHLRKLVLQQGLFACGYSEQEAIAGSEQCFEYFYQKRSDFKVADDIRQVLASLSERVPLVAITNGNVDLQRIGIDNYFSLCLKSSLSQPMKPSPVMFNLAAKKLAMPARHILHVGDNFKADVFGAINAGFSAAWYAHNRPMHLSSEPVRVLPHLQVDKLEELLSLSLGD